MSEQPSKTGDALWATLGIAEVLGVVVVLFVIYLLEHRSPLWVQITIGVVGWTVFLWGGLSLRRRKDLSNNHHAELEATDRAKR